MSDKDEPDTYWANITRDSAIRSLFPDLKDCEVDFSNMLPGLYWESHTEPKDPTPLDHIISFISGDSHNRVIKSKSELTDKGILCPFYTWRIMGALAVENASITYKNLTKDRLDKLNAERDNWQLRIDATKRIIRSEVGVGLHYGSVYLRLADFDSASRDACKDAFDRRKLNLQVELAQDEITLRNIELEISEILRISTKSPNGGMPKMWRMPIYFWMASLWRDMSIQSSGLNITFLELLRAFTKTIDNKGRGIDNWGQYKTADDVSKRIPFGEGLTIGVNNFFNCADIESVKCRGQEICDLIDYSQSSTIEQEIVSISHAALLLRDHSKGHLSIIARDIALRSAMRKIGWVSRRLHVQLGWIYTPRKNIVEDAVRRAMFDAKRGCAAAAAVLQAAYMFDEWARGYLENLGWNESFAGLSHGRIIGEFEISSGQGKTWPEMHGDEKSFEASMTIINDCYDLSIDAGNDTGNGIGGNLWSDPLGPPLKL